ncbi:N-acyl homoserine lactonase family protein [Roseixanthobacter liquoris]|uniref:N-acyl homoserine lactonase family protein n=1 Tax=Roseixanthobacter liquoris TaxID=3119921 RepID=UPI003729AEC3
MKMTAISGGTLQMRRSVYFEDAAPGELITLPVSCFLIQHPQGNVLFDTGCHPELVTGPVSRIGGMAKMMRVISEASVNVVQALEHMGITPGDIDVVVNSHLHPDHCGCNGFFGSATQICHRCELEAARQEEVERAGYFKADWAGGPPFTEIDGEYDVFGDGRIVLIPLPGHTPGSIGALVTLDRDGPFLLASDAASMRENLDQGTIPRNTWDTDRFSRSVEEMRRYQRAGFEVIYGHDDHQWTKIVRNSKFL